jgi:hypothetical protein
MTVRPLPLLRRAARVHVPGLAVLRLRGSRGPASICSSVRIHHSWSRLAQLVCPFFWRPPASGILLVRSRSTVYTITPYWSAEQSIMTDPRSNQTTLAAQLKK